MWQVDWVTWSTGTVTVDSELDTGNAGYTCAWGNAFDSCRAEVIPYCVQADRCWQRQGRLVPCGLHFSNCDVTLAWLRQAKPLGNMIRAAAAQHRVVLDMKDRLSHLLLCMIGHDYTHLECLEVGGTDEKTLIVTTSERKTWSPGT